MTHSFFSILQKHMGAIQILHLTSTLYLYDFWKHIFSNESNCIQSNMNHVAFYFYIQKCTDCIGEESSLYWKTHVKFREYKRLLDNTFLQNNGSPDFIQDLFYKSQKTYRAFSKLARLFLMKRATLQVNHDMYMMPIDLNNKNTMIIFQNGAKYAFKLSDLINILNSALSNSPDFFADPIFPRNPYTNIEFEVGALYEMYDRIKKSDYKMPVLINAFFCASFDLDKFEYDNEAAIRDVFLSDYVKNSTNETLFHEIKTMIRIYDKTKRIKIDKDFPVDRLVSIMRPYLHLHYINQYSLYETTKRNDICTELNKKMRRFIEFSPKFGRKIMKLTDENDKIFYPSFHEDHPDFNESVDNISFIDLMDASESEESD